MTVVVWDGSVLAADRRVTSQSGISECRKIRKIGGVLVGTSGLAMLSHAMFSWVMDGFKPPSPIRGPATRSGMLLIFPTGEIVRLIEKGQLRLIEATFAGTGCGYPFALGALYAGKTAREAVLIACQCDEDCGNGVDTLDFDSPDDELYRCASRLTFSEFFQAVTLKTSEGSDNPRSRSEE